MYLEGLKQFYLHLCVFGENAAIYLNDDICVHLVGLQQMHINDICMYLEELQQMHLNLCVFSEFAVNAPK